MPLHNTYLPKHTFFLIHCELLFTDQRYTRFVLITLFYIGICPLFFIYIQENCFKNTLVQYSFQRNILFALFSITH